jgi:hypothetical protein
MAYPKKGDEVSGPRHPCESKSAQQLAQGLGPSTSMNMPGLALTCVCCTATRAPYQAAAATRTAVTNNCGMVFAIRFMVFLLNRGALDAAGFQASAASFFRVLRANALRASAFTRTSPPVASGFMGCKTPLENRCDTREILCFDREARGSCVLPICCCADLARAPVKWA